MSKKFFFLLTPLIVGVSLWLVNSHKEIQQEVAPKEGGASTQEFTPATPKPVNDIDSAVQEAKGALASDDMKNRSAELDTTPHDTKENQIDSENTAPANTVEIVEITNDGSHDLSGIDNDLINNGSIFSAKFDSVLDSSDGDSVKLKFKNHEFSGILRKKDISQQGIPYAQIALDDKGALAYIHFGRNIKIGKIYTEEGQYIFEQKGDVGFIMEMNEYKKIKNAIYHD